MLRDCGGESALINVSRREVRLAEVRRFVLVVELKVERLGNLIICVDLLLSLGSNDT